MTVLLAALLLVSAPMSPAPSASPHAVPPGAAVIVNSGSTNTRGYQILVSPEGKATVVVDGAPQRSATLDAATRKAFFSALKAAEPLDKLASEPCMKSASFGSTTTVEYDGKRSPDVSCPMEGTGAKLASAVQDVVRAVHLQPVGQLRRTMTQPEVPGGGPLTPSPGSPKPTAT